MTVGMLGVAMLYVEGLRMNRTSINRTVAVNLTADMANRIAANQGGQASYAGQGPGQNHGCVNGVGRCSPQQQAADDWWWWLADVQANLPAGVVANITREPQGRMTRYGITLTWNEAGQDQPVSYTLPVQL